jgi:hypothetical protein
MSYGKCHVTSEAPAENRSRENVVTGQAYHAITGGDTLRWNNDREKKNNKPQINLPKCHFVHHKSRMDRYRIKPRMVRTVWAVARPGLNKLASLLGNKEAFGICASCNRFPPPTKFSLQPHNSTPWHRNKLQLIWICPPAMKHFCSLQSVLVIAHRTKNPLPPSTFCALLLMVSAVFIVVCPCENETRLFSAVFSTMYLRFNSPWRLQSNLDLVVVYKQKQIILYINTGTHAEP